MELPLVRPDWKPCAAGRLKYAKWPDCRATYSAIWLKGMVIVGLELTEPPPLGLPFGGWCWVTGPLCDVHRKLGRRKEVWINLAETIPQFTFRRFPPDFGNTPNKGLSAAEVAALRATYGLTDQQIAAMRT